jgi:hypothetical protein
MGVLRGLCLRVLEVQIWLASRDQVEMGTIISVEDWD